MTRPPRRHASAPRAFESPASRQDSVVGASDRIAPRVARVAAVHARPIPVARQRRGRSGVCPRSAQADFAEIALRAVSMRSQKRRAHRLRSSCWIARPDHAPCRGSSLIRPACQPDRRLPTFVLRILPPGPAGLFQSAVRTSSAFALASTRDQIVAVGCLAARRCSPAASPSPRSHLAIIAARLTVAALRRWLPIVARRQPISVPRRKAALGHELRRPSRTPSTAPPCEPTRARAAVSPNGRGPIARRATAAVHSAWPAKYVLASISDAALASRGPRTYARSCAP